MVGEVAVTDFLSVDNVKGFGAAAAKLVDERRVRVLSEAIEVAMVEESLESSVDPVSAFVEKETKEIAILENYLPAAPSDADLNAAIEAAIAETGANSPKAMGAVIKAAKARLEGKTVDGKILSDRVKERLGRS